MSNQLTTSTTPDNPVEPGRLLWVLLLWGGFLGVLTLAPGSLPALFRTIAGHFDNPKYIPMAEAIRSHNLNAYGATRYAWGFPFATALVATAFRITAAESVLAVSVVSSLAATWIAFRLWGMWVAAYFTVADFTWIQFSVFGGSEPLSIALLFASLMAARTKSWPLAAFFAALSATVRPVGVLLLPVLVPWAWLEQGLRTAVATAFAGSAVLALYILPLLASFHDPVIGYHGYQQAAWNGGYPITYPFVAIAANLMNGEYLGGSLNKLFKGGFILFHVFVLTGVACSTKIRQRALHIPVDLTFMIVYSAFIICYNDPHCAASIYARVLLPILPIQLWIYEPWLPKSRFLIVGLGLCSVFVALHAGALPGRPGNARWFGFLP